MTTFSMIPWSGPGEWRAANAALAHLVNRDNDALAVARGLAHRIQVRLALIFPVMERLCRETCPTCREICCRHACVWIDFKDLAFLHLAGLPIPETQVRGSREERCRWSGRQGCRLDRIRRPFICTWYLCPAQTRRLRCEPAQWQRTADSLDMIKRLRRDMETAFIHAAL